MTSRSSTSYTVTEKVFLWPGETASWHFLPVTRSVGQKIKELHKGQTRGFGSLPVTVTIGATTWKTSIFPDKTSDSFLLPLKAAVRKKEDILEGDTVTVSIQL